MASTLLAMAFNLEAMACNPKAFATSSSVLLLVIMASTLLAMASNREAMASNPKAFVTSSFLLLVVMASTLLAMAFACMRGPPLAQVAGKGLSNESEGEPKERKSCGQSPGDSQCQDPVIHGAHAPMHCLSSSVSEARSMSPLESATQRDKDRQRRKSLLEASSHRSKVYCGDEILQRSL